jgi:hypothetical protein
MLIGPRDARRKAVVKRRMAGDEAVLHEGYRRRGTAGSG